MVSHKSKIELLSEILGLTPRRIQQLAEEKIIPKPEKAGDYDIPQCVAYYYENIYSTGDEALDGRQERARKAKLEADRIEFGLDIKKGKYVEVDSVGYELEKSISNCRSKLLGLPSKAAPQLVNISKPASIENLLKKIINEALDELVTPNFEESEYTKDKEDDTEII